MPATACRGAVRIRVELLALFRDKTGTGQVELEVPAGCASALHALCRLEARLAPRGPGALEGGALRQGVLLFVRAPQAAMRRVADPAGELLRGGETLILATAMEGG
ncbi:MAG: hypothetical protein JW820_06855 [Spirochaetales bacterium]|nr:hypothetical protein [Spirochaetales bacterium]